MHLNKWGGRKVAENIRKVIDQAIGVLNGILLFLHILIFIHGKFQDLQDFQGFFLAKKVVFNPADSVS